MTATRVARPGDGPSDGGSDDAGALPDASTAD
jgi:hypothetical protein